MMRKHIAVGDSPACGGTVLPFECVPPTFIDGCQVALIGGRVLCAVCNSVGHIAKAGGPYRPAYSAAENALEGDMVVCECPVPSALVSTLGGRWKCDDRGEFYGEFDAARLPSNWYRPDPRAPISSKVIAESGVQQPPEADHSDLICPGMTNDKFSEYMLNLRDRALKVTQRRLHALDVWALDERLRVWEWFGRNDQEMRGFLQVGMTKVADSLRELNGKNFLKYTSEFGAAEGCLPSTPRNQIAAVCRTDVIKRRIAFTRSFCTIKDMSPLKDSQISTLIHEVTHFVDILGTYDHEYGLTQSKWMARTDSVRPMSNADSYAGYICENMVFPD